MKKDEERNERRMARPVEIKGKEERRGEAMRGERQ